jgi:hypothetical protein
LLRICTLVVAALAACTSESGTFTIERTHDACAPLTLVSEQPTERQYEGMRAAEELWRTRGALALGRRAGNTLEVRFDDASLAFRGLYDDQQAVIYINRGLTDPQTLAIVIAHELGHAFGLHHVEGGQPSVMSPGNLSTPPSEVDQRALEALWGACQ